MRNFSTKALILSVQAQGENNRSACIFSPDEGIFYATLFGGPKSKLRSLVSPMNSGIMYLYRDEVKKHIKITDFDVKNAHLTFRENLFKTFASALAAEILIKTRCAGSPDESWRLVNGFLDGMELSSEDDSRLGLVRFLWRYIDLLGIKPDTSECCRCGESLHALKFTDHALSYTYSYDIQENGFSCPECGNRTSDSTDTSFSLNKAAITYLEAISKLTPKEVRQISINLQTLTQMKDLCFFLIERSCASKLKALESGIGIL